MNFITIFIAVSKVLKLKFVPNCWLHFHLQIHFLPGLPYSTVFIQELVKFSSIAHAVVKLVIRNRNYSTFRSSHKFKIKHFNSMSLKIENYAGCNKNFYQIQLIAFLNTVWYRLLYTLCIYFRQYRKYISGSIMVPSHHEFVQFDRNRTFGSKTNPEKPRIQIQETKPIKKRERRNKANFL